MDTNCFKDLRFHMMCTENNYILLGFHSVHGLGEYTLKMEGTLSR